MTRILVAVDDSSGGVSAARTAVRLAALTGGHIRAITVESDGIVADSGSGAGASEADRGRAALDFVRDLAADHGIRIETDHLQGRPALVILDDATAWRADYIVVGRTGRHRIGEHFIGADAQHVLEFAEVPVVVVPSP
jgi:nucleotide-binding universal stress UspA family protein